MSEKQEEKLQKWLQMPASCFANEEAHQKYESRVKRFVASVTLKRPDRVPVVLPIGISFPAYYCGKCLKDIMYDYEELEKCWLKVAEDFDMDIFSPPSLVHPARVYEIIGHKYWLFPGRGLPEEAETYQYVESEYMFPDEYDELLKDPTDFFLRKLLPRTCVHVSALERLRPPKYFLFDPALFISELADVRVQQALENLLKGAREWRIWADKVSSIADQLICKGYPRLWELLATAPFDFIGDTLRGTKGIFLDMYRNPSKLLEVLDWCADLIVARISESSEGVISPFVFIPLHKGYDTFMSPRQYMTFYWPGLKKVISGIIQSGLVPWIFAEGEYNQRIDMIAQDLPDGYMVWHFERVNMVKAKELLGKRVCIAGNLSPLLVQAGNPVEVEKECKKLIETCGRNGGFILAGGASVNKANPENLRAIMKAAEKYGRYS